MLILSIGFGMPVVIEYFKTGLVSSILLVLSILLWITGIILDVIAKKRKQLYELYLNKLKGGNYEEKI